MIRNRWRAATRLATVLVDPKSTLVASIRDAQPLTLVLLLAVVLAALGVATLPRQLDLLARAFPMTGDATADAVAGLMRRGLTRLLVADRLVAEPVLLIAGVLVGVAAEPVLALPSGRRSAIWTVVVLGLAPLLIARVGELAVTWLVDVSAGAPPGDILLLPHRFRTGPALLWGGEHLPRWVEVLDGAVNLISFWIIGLWALGLRLLDGGERLAAWHVLLPAVCVGGGAVAVWIMAAPVLAVVLGTP